MLRRGWRPVPLILLLLLCGVAGPRDVVVEWAYAARPGQKVATGLELGNALAAWAALVGLGARRAFARPALFVWCALVTGTAGLAAVFWGDAGIAAALTGAAATFLVCFFAIRLAVRPAGDAARPEPS